MSVLVGLRRLKRFALLFGSGHTLISYFEKNPTQMVRVLTCPSSCFSFLKVIERTHGPQTQCRPEKSSIEMLFVEVCGRLLYSNIYGFMLFLVIIMNAL